MPKLNRALLPLAAAALALLALPAAAETFTAQLSGDTCVPEPIKTPATGQLQLVVADAGETLNYVVTVKDIDNAQAADLHLGPPGANGPLVAKLFPAGKDRPKKGAFSGVLAQGKLTSRDLLGPMVGASLGELLEQIRAGNAYINVHTNDGAEPPNSGPGDYRLGEIRGQIGPAQ